MGSAPLCSATAQHPPYPPTQRLCGNAPIPTSRLAWCAMGYAGPTTQAGLQSYVLKTATGSCSTTAAQPPLAAAHPQEPMQPCAPTWQLVRSVRRLVRLLLASMVRASTCVSWVQPGFSTAHAWHHHHHHHQLSAATAPSRHSPKTVQLGAARATPRTARAAPCVAAGTAVHPASLVRRTATGVLPTSRALLRTVVYRPSACQATQRLSGRARQTQPTRAPVLPAAVLTTQAQPASHALQLGPGQHLQLVLKQPVPHPHLVW
jgi:hypothetical protein